MQRHELSKEPNALRAFFRAITRKPVGLTSWGANAALVLGGLIGLPFIFQSSSPTENYPLDELNPPVGRTLVLLSADGQPFARRGGCVDKPVKFSELPRHFVDALLSMEDRRFFSHFGVDPIGISRAAYRNWHAGMIIEGGSTLTQQLVKFSYLSNKRTMARKQKEASLALWLELIYSKKEILERYLSSVYFGEGCFGLRAAAKHYFEKPVSELTLSESAFLVGLLKAPNLILDHNAAQERARLVLHAMVENERLAKSRLAETPPAIPRLSEVNHFGAHYADWLANTIKVDNGDYSPLPIQTAFRPELQRLAEKAVESMLSKQGKWRDASEAALVAMRTDGRVVAMVGGRNYAKSQFNRAVQALRQPGSSFKLFVYLAALRAGIQPDSVVVDEPIKIGKYEPKNFGKGYRGAVSIRRAFASSINTVAVQLSEATGRNNVIKAARDLGISTRLEPWPAIALGAWEVRLLELTSAYAAVAAGAYPVKPWGVLRLGKSTSTPPEPPQESGLWRLAVKDDIRALLRGVVSSGSGRRAYLPIRSYGKTGTSQDYRDAWFVGFAGNLVVGVWVGNDNFSPMRRVTGGSLPAQIWRKFMRDAMRSDPNFERKLPEIAAFEARTPIVQASTSGKSKLTKLKSGGDQISKSASSSGSSRRQRVRRADRGRPQLVGRTQRSSSSSSSRRRSSSSRSRSRSRSRSAAQASTNFRRQLSGIRGWPTN